MISPGTAGRQFSAASRPHGEGRPEGGYTDLFDTVCCDCGDHPYLDYSEVSLEFRRVRKPYPIADGISAHLEHLGPHHQPARATSMARGRMLADRQMNAEFFALAFLAALNPKLLALDLLLIENRRPRAMFLCLMLGGMTVALTIGLLDVLVFRADAIHHQASVSAGVDLALGLLLLASGALLATGRLHGRRKAPVPAGDQQPRQSGEEGRLGAAGAS